MVVGVGTWARSLPEKLRDPVTHTDLLQMAKSVVAAVAAWVLAIHVFHLQQPFLAPWSALLTVHATIYKTLARGVQQVGANVIGVLLAFGVGTLLGVNATTLAFALALGLLLGSMSLLRDEGITVATTALIVIATGYSEDPSILVERLIDTGIGIATGMVVNLLVFPPLNDRSAARQVDTIDDDFGRLLIDIHSDLVEGVGSDQVEQWVERTRGFDHDIDHAWSVVYEASESTRFNPRLRGRRRGPQRASQAHVLHGLEQAVAEARSMARTFAQAAVAIDDWDPRFKVPWLSILAQVGQAVADADAAAVADAERRLDNLSRGLVSDDLPGDVWPTYGALIINLRNIVTALIDVAAAQPMSLR